MLARDEIQTSRRAENSVIRPCLITCTGVPFMRRACPLLGAEITWLLLVNYKDVPGKGTNTNVLGARDWLASGCEYSWSAVRASQKKAPARGAFFKL